MGRRHGASRRAEQALSSRVTVETPVANRVPDLRLSHVGRTRDGHALLCLRGAGAAAAVDTTRERARRDLVCHEHVRARARQARRPPHAELHAALQGGHDHLVAATSCSYLSSLCASYAAIDAPLRTRYCLHETRTDGMHGDASDTSDV